MHYANIAFWKKVPGKTLKGNQSLFRTAMCIDRFYERKLLVRILEMPDKNPISLAEAIDIIRNKEMEATRAGDEGMKPGQSSWYLHNFVQYISDLGYHIELTGDEFEPVGAVSEIRA